ncbi:protein TIFY 6B isoform X2 [Lactuca sativa]|uniref:protein TIFY 6B isoform X2 n=1 Tax=Lactuca sativa TaxID=4236 RepID=UPI000CD9DA49|nr:protein TIFY 6B isoform X2 [Lactuca sativa]
MERDFMGLNSKDSVVVVKEEAGEGCKESVFSMNSAVHWPLSDALDASKNRQSGEIQNAVPISMSNPFFRTQFGGAPLKQHGVSVIPPNGSFLAGTTEPWYSSKTSCAPAQLTIFYGGMVNVYDDISPEKAQAIMFLAGNGASVTTPQARVPTQVATPSPINVQPCSAISSPMSVSSHPVGQSSGGPTNKDEVGKPVGGSVPPASKVDTPRVINSLEQVMQSAVPQARKASLARFLEKRKERVMASSPYSINKSSSDYITNPGPNAIVATGEH